MHQRFFLMLLLRSLGVPWWLRRWLLTGLGAYFLWVERSYLLSWLN